MMITFRSDEDTENKIKDIIKFYEEKYNLDLTKTEVGLSAIKNYWYTIKREEEKELFNKMDSGWDQ